jgi:hypothetical protein
MPRNLKFYRDKEKMKAARKRHKKNNYAKGSIYNFNSGKRFTDIEKRFVQDHLFCDRKIAKILGRTVVSIQALRMQLKKKGKINGL